MASPCLFNVVSDPEERHDLARERPDKLRELLAVLDTERKALRALQLQLGKPAENKTAFCEAAAANGGFLVPWLE